MFSCVAMAWEHPGVVKNSLEWRVMFYLDIMFTAIFGIELIMKTLALSFHIYIKTLTNKVGSLFKIHPPFICQATDMYKADDVH